MLQDRSEMIAVIDYGAGNLRSVVNAIKKLGYEPKVTTSARDLADARAVILPGVGAAGDAISNLEKFKLAGPIRRLIDEGKPFLGVCLGLQVLLDGTDEGGWHECLGIIPGRVKRLSFKDNELKIPHMGWNQVKQK